MFGSGIVTETRKQLLAARVSVSHPQRCKSTKFAILCTDVLQREAIEQGKSLSAHAAHLVVHGVLHAQGYDHVTEAEADEMEGIEAEILAGLGIENPYRSK